NPVEGGQITFTLTVGNSGPDRGSGISVSARLPSGLSLDGSQLSQGSYDDSSGVWSVGALKANATAELVLTATVETTDTVNFTAEITASEQFDPDSTPGNGVSGEDDQATAAIGTCLVGGSLHVGMNKLTYACASPGAFTAFVQGTTRGSFTFDQYRTTVDIADAVEIAIGIADSNGVAEALFYVSEDAVSGSMLFQAFEMFPRKHKTNTLQLSASTDQLRATSIGDGAAALQRDVIDAHIAEAMETWYAAGLSPTEFAGLQSATVVVSNLPGNVIARAVGRTIVLDSDAAGHGWFVDRTPWESSEFSSGSPTRLAIAEDAIGRVDLLTTLLHEFGHVLGMPDVNDPNHVMNSTLAVGQRRLLTPGLNSERSLDVNRDELVTSLDALLVINRLNRVSASTDGQLLQAIGNEDARFDTNGDLRLSALDALVIVNHLRDAANAEAESVLNIVSPGSGSQLSDRASVSKVDSASIDSIMPTLLDDRETTRSFRATSSAEVVPLGENESQGGAVRDERRDEDRDSSLNQTIALLSLDSTRPERALPS
ncbi:MAG: dockerin type I domain-containing protein, partial [Rubripirellula sp.]